MKNRNKILSLIVLPFLMQGCAIVAKSQKEHLIQLLEIETECVARLVDFYNKRIEDNFLSADEASDILNSNEMWEVEQYRDYIFMQIKKNKYSDAEVEYIKRILNNAVQITINCNNPELHTARSSLGLKADDASLNTIFTHQNGN